MITSKPLEMGRYCSCDLLRVLNLEKMTDKLRVVSCLP